MRSTVHPVAWTTIRTPVKTYERDGKRFCRMPETGREVNMTDFTFKLIEPAASKNGKTHQAKTMIEK